MKSSVEVTLISAAAAAAGFATWIASDRPPGTPPEELASAPLKPGEVRLETLREQGLDDILWIDARKQAAWEADGLQGSIHLTILSDESLAAQVERHFEELARAKEVVVYCDDLHCSLSHDLAEALREQGVVSGEILVLQGGMTALRQAGMVRGSNRGS